MRLLGWLACAGSVVLLVAAMVMAAAPADAGVPGLRVTGAWVRLAAVAGRPAAGYFTLTTSAPAVLTGVVSPNVRIELHDMTAAGGVMRMRSLSSVRADAGAPVRFAPGGAHLMLFDVARLRPGATLPLTFVFADGTRVAVAATVVAAGGKAAMPGMAPGMTM